MEDNFRQQQIEALEALKDYNIRLVNSMKIIITELREERKEDTDIFQEKIIDGINWEIEVLNGTLSLINEKKERINKVEINKNILELGNAIKSGNDLLIADVFEKDIIPTFIEIGNIAEIVIEEGY